MAPIGTPSFVPEGSLLNSNKPILNFSLSSFQFLLLIKLRTPRGEPGFFCVTANWGIVSSEKGVFKGTDWYCRNVTSTACWIRANSLLCLVRRTRPLIFEVLSIATPCLRAHALAPSKHWDCREDQACDSEHSKEPLSGLCWVTTCHCSQHILLQAPQDGLQACVIVAIKHGHSSAQVDDAICRTIPSTWTPLVGPPPTSYRSWDCLITKCNHSGHAPSPALSSCGPAHPSSLLKVLLSSPHRLLWLPWPSKLPHRDQQVLPPSRNLPPTTSP